MSTNKLPTIYYSDLQGNPKNCVYSNEGEAKNAEELKAFMAFDHVFIKFKNNYRSTENFIQASNAVFDCDNDHTEEPSKWLSPKDILTLFPDVPCIISTSRNHMKQKRNKVPRPRFHVIFPISPIISASEYTEFMKKAQGIFPFFDSNALDAARFFFGNADTQVAVIPGSKSFEDFIKEKESEDDFAMLGNTIPEGSRNNAMSLYAGKILKRLGDTEEAYSKFLQKAEECSPPLEDSELETIWQSAKKFYKKVSSQPDYVSPEEYEKTDAVHWETPIPFEQAKLPVFPVEALPPAVRDYVLAVAESTQTPVDMSASAALAILALCEQGKFRIRGKADWVEPVNLFMVVVAEPSERKSAVVSLMTKPVNEYEATYNKQNAAALETSKMNKRILERRQRTLEDKAAKGKAEYGELERIAEQLATFKEENPLRLYVDDVTTEKLTGVLAEGGGKAAIVSAEGGIFDMLSGLYSKNVNIDVMLKGYSGDCIRVDRIGRNSESIMNPALTVLLTVQPNVLSGIMQNGTFRGRGLTARFLYCMPRSIVGNRRYRTEAISEDVSLRYSNLIRNILEEEPDVEPEEITLSPEADKLLETFSCEVESKLKTEYADISDWAGKLVGAVLRISGVLCRASVSRYSGFLETPDPLVVDKETMEKSIAIGRYYIEHSSAAFSLMGADELAKKSQYVLNSIYRNGLTEFSKRDLMRVCRSFKSTEVMQPVLNHLVDYGYIAPKVCDTVNTKGRPTSQSYLVNPYLYENAS